jgi:hypothetical protein
MPSSRAHDEVALGRAPQLRLAVLGPAGNAGVRLDVALMHGLGVELALDHDVGLCKTFGGVAERELDPLGDVRGLRRRRFDTRREHVLVQQRRPTLHRLDHVDHMRQDLVVDLDQLQRLPGDRRAGGGHRGHGMPLVEDLLARHDVAHHVAIVDQHLARRHELRGHVLEVVARHHRLDARQRQRLGDVDRPDPRVRMRAAQDPADQHAGHGQIGAEAGPSGDLVDAVRPYRTRADPFQRGLDLVSLQRGGHLSFL